MAFALSALPAIFSSTAASSAIAASTASAAALGGIETASIPIAAATAPAWMGYTSLALTGLGGVTGAMGAIASSNAQAGAARYNAEVAQINAEQAKRNAQFESESGMAQAAMQERKTRALEGSLKANQAASGVDVNSGSALDVRSSAAELGELDAISVRSNATKAAYGYQTQENSFKNEATLDESEAKKAKTAGALSATGTLLGAAGTGFDNYYRYKLAGGFGG